MTKTEIKHDSLTIIVKASKGTSEFHWGGWRKKYRITIEINGKKAIFTYHDAQVNFNNDELDESNIKDAFTCILSDANSANNARSFEDFCREFGYDIYSDRREGRRVFNACERTADKLFELGLNEGDIVDILNREDMQ